MEKIKEKTWNFIDKSGWGEGEWMSEPDKIQWTDPITSFPCLIVRAGTGALCGYVGIAKNHLLFGKVHDASLSGKGYYDTPSFLLDAHGGVTFSTFCQEDKEHGICHIPEPGQSDRVWWLGFDCGHFCDICPAFSSFQPMSDYETYKNVKYVKEQVRLLAMQLHVIGIRGVVA